MQKKKIIFILGSGRCGTYSFYNSLNKLNNIEIHHEFFFEPTLKIASLYHMKEISKYKVQKFINENYFFSIKNSSKNIWINACNAMPWMSDVLVEMFPNARFVHLVRNGRKVVSSFYHKFGNLMYNKKDIIILKKFLDKKINLISSEKKYWRPIPHKNNNDYLKFINQNQFYKICWYWSQINNKIEKSLNNANKKIFFKFENVNNDYKFLELIDFLEIEKKQIKHLRDSFSKPINVKIPKNYILNKNQEKIFKKICHEEMTRYNYSLTDDYETIY
jgi:hypothetical protein